MYEKLIGALRCCATDYDVCNKCVYQYPGMVSAEVCKWDMMQDAAAAIEALQALLKEADKKQAYQHDYICELVAEVEELKAAQPHWVSVDERLPEIRKIVLVYDGWDRLSICQLDNQYRWLRQGGGWFDVPYVRYWMPIEPPQEVQDGTD